MSSLLAPFASHWQDLPEDRKRQLRRFATKALQSGDMPVREIHRNLDRIVANPDDPVAQRQFAPSYQVAEARIVQRIEAGKFPGSDAQRKAMVDPVYQQIFGNQNRLYIPFTIEETFPDPALVDWLADKNCKIQDYAGGMAVNQKGQPQRIGKMLAKAITAGDEQAEKLKYDFELRSWPEMMMVVTRDPVDMARVSTGRGWESCHAANGDYPGQTRADWEYGTFAIYMTDPEDVTVLRPRARLTVRPHFSIDDNETVPVFRPANPIGLHVPGFKSQVEGWLDHSVNHDRYGLFVLPQKISPDGMGRNWVRRSAAQIELEKWMRADAVSLSGLDDCLVKGGDINLPVSERGELALHMAMWSKNLMMIEALLARGADPNGRVDIVDSPIFMAVNEKEYNTAKILLGAGADPDRGNIFGMTPLMAACYNHAPDMVKLLLDNGANPDIVYSNADMKYPLCIAINAGDTEIAGLLLAAGANPLVENNKGENALAMCLARKDYGLVAQALQNIDYRIPAAQEANILCELARVEQVDLIRTLVTHGANINQQSKYGDTPLAVALQAHNKSTALCLLDLGADPNIFPYTKLSPLFQAVSMNDPEFVKRIVAAGADVMRSNADGDDVFDFAIETRRSDMLVPLFQALPDDISRGKLRRLRFFAEAHEMPALTAILDARKPAAPAPAMRM